MTHLPLCQVTNEFDSTFDRMSVRTTFCEVKPFGRIAHIPSKELCIFRQKSPVLKTFRKVKTFCRIRLTVQVCAHDSLQSQNILSNSTECLDYIQSNSTNFSTSLSECLEHMSSECLEHMTEVANVFRMS